MDKRTLLFIVLISLTFLGVNLYFSQKTSEKNRILLKEREAKIKEATALKASEIQKRQAKLSDLPLVQVYEDSAQTKLIGTAIDVTGNTLLLAWTTPLPQEIYVNGKVKKLMTKGAVLQGPVLYGEEPFTPLEIALLPQVGRFDVQLVTFNQNEQNNVHLAEYNEGDIELFDSISSNAIALYKTARGYLPLGFYENQSKVFVELQYLPLLSGLTFTEKAASTKEEPPSQEKKYFVLENSYQQLVFSNVGGAIVEINLPFKSETNQKSVVNEIEFGRELVKENPANSYFPSQPFVTADNKNETHEGTLGGYYPLLRRSIKGKKESSLSPEYYALNIVSNYPEMAELIYKVTSYTDTSITFEASQPHRKITKTFTLLPGEQASPYIFDLSIEIEGDRRGLWLTSGVPEVEIMSNNSSPQIMYHMSRKQEKQVEKISLPKPDEIINMSSLSPDWVVNSNGYLGIILDPLGEMPQGFRVKGIYGGKVPTRLSLIDPPYFPYPAAKYPGYELFLPLATSGKLNFRIYAGPFEEKTLKTVDRTFTDRESGYNPHYSASRSFHGWLKFITQPFAKLLFIVMSFFYGITHSWGFSIILLTVFLKAVLYPLNTWSIKSMRRMQQIAPEIKAIQKKHKKDPKKSQMEIMALYREKKVNPFTGCIPILIQIPFLIAMFDLLKSSFQLRGASFIPGWINDLTAPDVLFQWKSPIFFIGNQFHLLPILLGVVMFFQQRLSASANVSAHASELTDQQRQQRAMGTIMTIVFTVMFYHFPSGLNIYWLSSMSLGILQQWITNKVLDKQKIDLPLKRVK